METDESKTEHIETSYQLDGTRKTRKLERKRDGKGMRTGRELDGTGRGRGRGWERDVNGARTERDGNGAGTGLNGTERKRDGMERC